MPVIETENLGRSFGATQAVDHLDLRVEEGEVFGLLGPNGAGKTTTMRILCTLIQPTSGTAWVTGRDVRDRRDAVEIRRRVGVLPEAPGLYPSLTPVQNLDFHGRLHGLLPGRRRGRVEELLRWLDLWDRRDEAVATLSRGMRQKVALARALIHDPDLLFLDEPTASLDPGSARSVRELILGLRDEGRTVFLNTHNLAEAERVCDRIGILNTRLLAQGRPEDLSVGRWKTVSAFRLRAVTDPVLAALEALDVVEDVTVNGGELLVRTPDPARHNPALVRAIVEAGGEVEFLTEHRPGLEDVYLRLVEEVA